MFSLFSATTHSQLSVVIVPVVFSLVAVVLIVFGVAYYVQNRNQFLVEVADFNFGETQSVDSLEYKSFIQRLLDSISDLFIRHNYNEDPDSPGGESSQPYNTMRWEGDRKKLLRFWSYLSRLLNFLIRLKTREAFMTNYQRLFIIYSTIFTYDFQSSHWKKNKSNKKKESWSESIKSFEWNWTESYEYFNG